MSSYYQAALSPSQETIREQLAGTCFRWEFKLGRNPLQRAVEALDRLVDAEGIQEMENSGDHVWVMADEGQLRVNKDGSVEWL